MSATDHRERVMSIDHEPQKTDLHDDRAPQRGSRRGRFFLLLGVLVAVLAAAGVAFAVTRESGSDDVQFLPVPPPATAPASSGDGGTAPPSVAPPSVAPPSVAPSQSPLEAESPAVLAQYRKFWAIFDQLPDTPAADRGALWGQVATGRSYEVTLGAVATADAAGEGFYGDIVINPTVALVEGSTATVRDCQDASQTGRLKKSTGEKVTVGTKADLLLTTLVKGADGVWRVSEARYLQLPC